MRILIVDDDPKLRSYVAGGLSESGMQCASADSPDEANRLIAEREAAGSDPFDLILLDVMMPGRSGWAFLEELRARGDKTPTIFVSARGAVEERVKGLQLGADDYMVKPFAFEELLARIDAVIRRREQLPVIRHDGLVVDPVRRRVELDDTSVDLSQREYDLLLTFLDSGGEVLDRIALLRKVWKIEFDPETNVVEVHIARLRRKLGARGKQVIQTVPGQGYKLSSGG